MVLQSLGATSNSWTVLVKLLTSFRCAPTPTKNVDVGMHNEFQKCDQQPVSLPAGISEALCCLNTFAACIRFCLLFAILNEGSRSEAAPCTASSGLAEQSPAGEHHDVQGSMASSAVGRLSIPWGILVQISLPYAVAKSRRQPPITMSVLMGVLGYRQRSWPNILLSIQTCGLQYGRLIWRPHVLHELRLSTCLVMHHNPVLSYRIPCPLSLTPKVGHVSPSPLNFRCRQNNRQDAGAIW